MKKIKCGHCRQVLGVPGKYFGKNITCPNCKKTLTINLDRPGTEAAGEADGGETDDAESSVAAGKTATIVQRSLPAARSPNFGRLSTMPATADAEETQDNEQNGSPAVEEQTENEPTVRTAEKPATARIISVEEPVPEMAREGDLPTLQLKESKKAKVKSDEKKTAPVLIGVIMCCSLVMSGLILFLADFQPPVNQRALSKAREELTRFYTVRIDVPLKPYQIHLREAQLAHSRGDRDAEIAAYRKVMEMFRAEDRNKFVGVTGSPTADAELEHLVSIMLGNGRESSTRFFR